MFSTDKRWKHLGSLLVNYSAEVRPGERVMIAMTELESFPLVHAVYEAVVKVGAYPQVQFLSETLRHLLIKYGTIELLDWVPEIEAYGMEWGDVYFGLRGAHNLHEQWDVAADRLSRNQATMGRVSTLRWEKTRWCLVRVPNSDFAQQAGTDLETSIDMFFDSCLIDWRTESAKWSAWTETLSKSSVVRIVGKNTDLSFSVEGRKWSVAGGKLNMPDGEISTAPLTETVDGQIFFENPGVLGGRLMHDLTLRWEHGQLVHAHASTNQEYLQSIVNHDAGAGLIGEFALGTNLGVTRFSNDILMDEKINGTVHIALGRAYTEHGGTNKSAIHWDIVKDIRKEGAVYIDNRCILQHGDYLF